MDIPVEIERLYNELIGTVASHESSLEEDVLQDESFGVHKTLRRPLQLWGAGRKSLRTVPVVRAYEEMLDESVPENLLRTLTGLDATINVLDDIIDTPDMDKTDKIDFTANVAFAGMLAFSNIPPEHRERVIGQLTTYLTELFQIPLVERRSLEAMRQAESVEDTIGIARECYAYRSRDIDAFAALPGIFYGFEDELFRTVIEDFRVYRAHELMNQDITDVRFDLRDEDFTPVIAVMDSVSDHEQFLDWLFQLYDEFEYSGVGGGYVDVLRVHEARPPNLSKEVKRQMERVKRNGS